MPDRYRGRVFAAELFGVTIMQASISFGTASMVEWVSVDPRTMALWIGAAMWMPGIAWILFAPRIPATGPAPIPNDTEQAEEESTTRAGHG